MRLLSSAMSEGPASVSCIEVWVPSLAGLRGGVWSTRGAGDLDPVIDAWPRGEFVFLADAPETVLLGGWGSTL